MKISGENKTVKHTVINPPFITGSFDLFVEIDRAVQSVAPITRENNPRRNRNLIQKVLYTSINPLRCQFGIIAGNGSDLVRVSSFPSLLIS